MKLFVTGGAGYIGSVVSELLVANDHDVIVFDNLSTGHRNAVHPACSFVQGDLRDEARLMSALTADVDAVLHFAAKSLVAESMREPLAYYEHNVGAAVSLLRVMQARAVERLVFSSTAAIYGEPDRVPTPEDAPARPTHAYGGSKYSIEMLFEDAMRASPLRVVSLRYFNAAGASAHYGEAHDPETHLIPNLLRSALRDEVVRVFGDDHPTPDGSCIRDYVHVVDLAGAHLRALQQLDSGVCGSFNLGCGRGHSVFEVLNAARKVTGKAIPARVEARRPGDPPRLVADTRRAMTVLGWQPRYRQVEEMIRSAWEWLRAHPAGYVSGGAVSGGVSDAEGEGG